MDIHNLATVIAPNVLLSNNKMESMDDSFLGIEAVHQLLQYNDLMSEVSIPPNSPQSAPVLTSPPGPRGSPINPKRLLPLHRLGRHNHQRDPQTLRGHRPRRRPPAQRGRHALRQQSLHRAQRQRPADPRHRSAPRLAGLRTSSHAGRRAALAADALARREQHPDRAADAEPVRAGAPHPHAAAAARAAEWVLREPDDEYVA